MERKPDARKMSRAKSRLALLLAVLLVGVFAFGMTCASSGGQDAPAEGSSATAAAGASAADVDASRQTDPKTDARLLGVREDGQALSATALAAIAGEHPDYTARPVAVLQLPELPSGCEIAALAAALQCLGFDVQATEIADEHLAIDGTEYGYLASPRSDSGGGFPPGVVDAANSYLVAQGSALRAHDLTGSTFESICALVDAGFPVLVWTTLDQTPPNYDSSLGGTDEWFVNEHCMTLYRANGTTVYANDPLNGLVELDAGTFARVYRQCGRMALYIRPL